MHTVTAHGAEIPALGFGTFRMNDADTARMVAHALKIGYRHVDTAQIYRNEAAVGRGLAASGIRRADVFLTTKVWVDAFAEPAFAKSVDDSLARLGTDYVDLLLLHWPNDKVPLADQIGSLNAVRQAGKVRHIGVSNYSTALMAQAVALSAAPIVTNQIEYHPYLDQTPVLDAARAAGMSVTAYYAMADGRILADPVVAAIAERLGRTPAQVVLRWLVQQDGVVALSKTVGEDRAAANLAIAGFTLSAEDMAAIHALRRPDGRIVSPAGLAPAWD